MEIEGARELGHSAEWRMVLCFQSLIRNPTTEEVPFVEGENRNCGMLGFRVHGSGCITLEGINREKARYKTLDDVFADCKKGFRVCEKLVRGRGLRRKAHRLLDDPT